MTDFTREQAIEWCVDNAADFITPIFPPPNGWMWADFDEEKTSLILCPIFTNSDDKDIYAKDIILAYSKRMMKSPQ